MFSSLVSTCGVVGIYQFCTAYPETGIFMLLCLDGFPRYMVRDSHLRAHIIPRENWSTYIHIRRPMSPGPKLTQIKGTYFAQHSSYMWLLSNVSGPRIHHNNLPTSQCFFINFMEKGHLCCLTLPILEHSNVSFRGKAEKILRSTE